MAEVHIVDIDGEQWDIKDLPLTNKVTTLENITIPELKNDTVKMANIKTRARDDGTPDFYVTTFPIQTILSKIKPNSNIILTVTYSNTNITQTLFYDGTNFTPSPQNVGIGIFYYLPQYFALYFLRSVVSLNTDIMITLLYTEKQ